MNPIQVMVNGLPGNMAAVAARHVSADDRFNLRPYSLTGPEITDRDFSLENIAIRLIRPDERQRQIQSILDDTGQLICIDYTHPSAVNDNADFYCRNQMPFVMGTTGGDRQKLVDTVSTSKTAAVIAPNMAKQIVGFQAMMAYGAESFPDLFSDYRLEIRESHQAGKADTSGTAKAMVTCFKKLGLQFEETDIEKERDPEIQKNRWGIPEADLTGHGWHTYTLTSADETVKFEFTHNVNGREIYAQGTLDAAVYLHQKLQQGASGKVYTMIDVLKKE